MLKLVVDNSANDTELFDDFMFWDDSDLCQALTDYKSKIDRIIVNLKCEKLKIEWKKNFNYNELELIK